MASLSLRACPPQWMVTQLINGGGDKDPRPPVVGVCHDGVAESPQKPRRPPWWGQEDVHTPCTHDFQVTRAQTSYPSEDMGLISKSASLQGQKDSKPPLLRSRAGSPGGDDSDSLTHNTFLAGTHHSI